MVKVLILFELWFAVTTSIPTNLLNDLLQLAHMYVPLLSSCVFRWYLNPGPLVKTCH